MQESQLDYNGGCEGKSNASLKQLTSAPLTIYGVASFDVDATENPAVSSIKYAAASRYYSSKYAERMLSTNTLTNSHVTSFKRLWGYDSTKVGYR